MSGTKSTGERSARTGLIRIGATIGALIVVLLGVVGVRVLAGVGSPTGDETTADRRTLVVRAAPADPQGAYLVTRTFVGEVRPRRETMLGFELGGMVESIEADDGDVVERDAVLARLDTDRLRARRHELEAAREEAAALLDLAEATERRTLESFERGAANEQEVDDAVFNRVARAAALRRIDNQIESIDVDLRKNVLRSPFEAVVARRMVDEGGVVSAGAPVFELLEAAAPEARIGVAGASIGAVRAGDRVEVRIRGRVYGARVTAVLPTRDVRTRAVECVLALDARLDGIRRGDLASLQVERTVEEAGFWLPMTAVTESARGLWACFVAAPLDEPLGDATHRVERREVEALHVEAERLYVAGGIEAGDLVIVEGPHRVAPGQRVRIEGAGGS